MIVIILLILTFAEAVCFVLTGAARFLIGAGICTFFALIERNARKRGKTQQRPRGDGVKHLLLAVLLSAVPFITAPITLHTKHLWKYPFQKALIQVYNKMPKWFPELKNIVQSDFSFEYMPTIMQGTGHECLRFMTTPERAKALEAQFAAQAKYTMPLPETKEQDRFFELTVPEEARGLFANSEWDGTADFFYDGTFWYPENKVRPDAVIYILDARGNWNHSGCSAVIISSDGAVQFSQFGSTSLAYRK